MHSNAPDTTTTNDATTTTTTGRSKARRLSIAGATTAVALVATGFGYQQLNDDTVVLSLDGQTEQVSTDAETVGDLLAEQGVELAEHDVVAPAPDAAVKDGQRVAVRFARPLTLAVDGKESEHWVTATDVSSALDQIGLRAAGAELSVSRGSTIDRDGLEISIGRPKQVTFAYGAAKPATETVTAVTVAEALADQGLGVDGDDVVKPALGSTLADGDTIKVYTVDVRSERVNEKIDNKTKTVRDGSMYEGQRKVSKEGRDGSRDVTYNVKRIDDRVHERAVEAVHKTVAPVDRVVRVGVKKKPAPEPARTSRSSSSTSSSSSSTSAPRANYAGGSSVWDRLAKCEAGGNWSINTGNGYYGGLQFNLGTWRAMGGPGMPHQQSRETQIAIAEKLRANNGGYGAWPACSSKLGLPR